MRALEKWLGQSLEKYLDFLCYCSFNDGRYI